ncbi:methionyl-tRNA formyltransferase [Paenibacillus hodogayensis]|uniref:Methionyl-tRNA formyltransferase n=1 Tax=Paenibacillus hodogayensis TaxID=279208 RepID=A0ABV5VSR4_9BACL
MKRILFLVATQKGYEVIKEVYSKRKEFIGLVSTFREVNVRESYSEKIEQFCSESTIEFLWWRDLKKDLIGFIEKYKITEVITIGWRYLLPLEINNHLENKFIIFHDSLLPKYRGFAPTPTAVICGEKEIGMSVIFSHQDVDSGPILIQKRIKDTSDMYIKEIISLQSELFKEAVIELLDRIEKNDLEGIIQDDSKATYSAWRGPEDCQIDWNKSSEEIFNFIRAISTPYPGAYTYLDNNKIIVWQSEVQDDINFAIRYPGKIWSIDAVGNPTVVCGRGMLKLLHVTNEAMGSVEFNFVRKTMK